MIGILLALGIQAPFVSGDSSCIKPDSFNLSTSTNEFFTDLSTYSPLNLTEPQIISLSNWEKNKYTYIALIMTAIYFVGLGLLLLFVSEKKGRFNLSLNNLKSFLFTLYL